MKALLTKLFVPEARPKSLHSSEAVEIIAKEWVKLEDLARATEVPSNRARTNLMPDGERDNYGYLREGIPSRTLTEGDA